MLHSFFFSTAAIIRISTKFQCIEGQEYFEPGNRNLISFCFHAFCYFVCEKESIRFETGHLFVEQILLNFYRKKCFIQRRVYGFNEFCPRLTQFYSLVWYSQQHAFVIKIYIYIVQELTASYVCLCISFLSKLILVEIVNIVNDPHVS